MIVGIRGLSPWAVAVGLVLVLGPQPWAVAQKDAKISVGDAPSLKQGSPEFVLVEVSDFQCPFCRQSTRQVLPQLRETLIQAGKIELIFLDFPLKMHPNAFKAAEAAACAGDQKKFWPMHDLLFEHQDALAPAQLPGYAAELGLNVPAFQACLDGGKHGGAIRDHARTAQSLGITGTPAYVLGRRIAGSDKIQVVEVIKGVGVPDYDDLEAKLNALLASK
jgi:protein-disulfide isomerase